MQTLRRTEVKDSKGRILPTVMAQYITADEAIEIKAAGQILDEKVLVVMHRKPQGSLQTWALALGWKMQAGLREEPKPDRNKVHRCIERLEKQKLVTKEGKGYRLTAAGIKRASTAENINHIATSEDTLQ
jgi:hypothetical protein